MKWHQMGFASETECNFIGFRINQNDMIYTFNIQGTAMPYVLPRLQGTDEKSFDQILKTVHPGILKNYQESINFRKNMKHLLRPVFFVL
jgi:hypothetical protein